MMISVEGALKIMLGSVVHLSDERIPIMESTGRIIFDDIIAGNDIPPFHNSAMDGYAVKCENIGSASADHPAVLPVIGEIKAGDKTRIELRDGAAIGIMTGAAIPMNADTVIPVEHTKESDGRVYIYKPAKKFENIRCAGEDIAKGNIVFSKGDLIKPANVGLLASLNYTEVPVYRQPHVAVISTGDEIAEPGDNITNGQIRNSNAYTLLSDIKLYRAIPHYLGIAKDTPGDIIDKLNQALQYDIIITTGGVSMGKYDFVKDVLHKLDISIKTEKIRMKPGKPLIFGTKGNRLFFGLPGNPVSTMVAFMLFVRPVILSMMGSRSLNKPLVRARLVDAISKKPDRRHFIRGYFTIQESGFHVATTGPQGSGILRSMSEANCLIVVPEGVEQVGPGDWVSIMLIDHGEIL